LNWWVGKVLIGFLLVVAWWFRRWVRRGKIYCVVPNAASNSIFPTVEPLLVLAVPLLSNVTWLNVPNVAMNFPFAKCGPSAVISLNSYFASISNSQNSSPLPIHLTSFTSTSLPVAAERYPARNPLVQWQIGSDPLFFRNLPSILSLNLMVP